MFRGLGAILLIAGTVGMAWAYCREQMKRLEHIKTIKLIYQFLQNEVLYAKASLPEICRRLSEYVKPPFGQAFNQICEEMNKNNGRSFKDIWTENLEYGMRELPLKAYEKRLLLDFPDSLGFRDGQGQADSLDRYIAEADQAIAAQENEIRNKNKVIMCFGVMSGIMMVILLL